MKSFCKTYMIHSDRGITLLLVLLLLSSILSISIGIFNLTIGEIRVSGEVVDSFNALYAADEGIEKTLYMDRIAGNVVCVKPNGSPAYGTNCYVDNEILTNGSGFMSRVTKSANSTEITVIGQYRCPGSVGPNLCVSEAFRIVKRGFFVSY